MSHNPNNEELTPEEEKRFYERVWRQDKGTNTFPVTSGCAHDACTNCNGTGRGKFGHCVHALVCSCPKHTVIC